MSGTVNSQEIVIDPSGEYQAKEPTSRAGSIDVNCAGHAAVRVSQEPDVWTQFSA
jgi:hypothetical protein